MCEDVKRFFRYMVFYNGGSVFVRDDGSGWYVGKRINDSDIWLATYNKQKKPADLYADILREFRERVFIDNFTYKRPRFTREALSYLYMKLLEDGETVFPKVFPGGRKYISRRYEA